MFSYLSGCTYNIETAPPAKHRYYTSEPNSSMHFQERSPQRPPRAGLGWRTAGRCPATHSFELHGLYSSGCAGPCQLKIGLSGD